MNARPLLVRIGIPLVVLLVGFSVLGYRYLPVAVDYIDDESCVGCHRQTNENLVAQWMGSAHFDNGVGCEDCHTGSHEAMFGSEGAVPASICAGCHAAEAKEFARSGHSDAWRSAQENARFKALPPAMGRQGCMTCHDIGREWPDGSRGQCNHCHSGHRFSALEAREPRACEGCHMGPDHPQIEAWRASKHGIVFESLHDESTAPTCVTCHLGGDAGHDSTYNLTLGHVSSGAAIDGEPTAVPMRHISREDFKLRRGRMVAICRDCHSEGFSRRALSDADEIKRSADGLVAEAVDIIRALEADGLLDPMPADRPPHPEAGHTLVLGGEQLYSDTSLIEQRLFEMFKFNHSATFKGAYHNSPDHTHWLGWARMQGDLTFIRTEARRLRGRAEDRAARKAAPTQAPVIRAPVIQAPVEAPDATLP